MHNLQLGARVALRWSRATVSAVKRIRFAVMSLPSGTKPIVIVCALQFECAQLRKAGLEDIFDIDCCGPGPRGVMSWARQRVSDRRPVILAGLAGGLTDSARIGEAFVIESVRKAVGSYVQPSLILEASDAPRATVSCPADVITTPDAKRAWHRSHNTDLIDLESESFALAMNTAGRPWAIVRGVSDGPDDELPAAMVKWVDEQGNTRTGAVAMSLLRNPRLVAVSKRIGKQATEAMTRVADVLSHATSTT